MTVTKPHEDTTEAPQPATLSEAVELGDITPETAALTKKQLLAALDDHLSEEELQVLERRD